VLWAVTACLVFLTIFMEAHCQGRIDRYSIVYSAEATFRTFFSWQDVAFVGISTVAKSHQNEIGHIPARQEPKTDHDNQENGMHDLLLHGFSVVFDEILNGGIGQEL
jgi:hypothetical protein